MREDSGSFLITHNGTIEEKNLSCYIDSKLDKHTNYIIRVQMLHHANFSMPWFFFVLLPKDPQTNTICDSKVTYNEMFSGSVNRIIKGKKLCSGQTNIGTSKLLELRINLSKQYLKIADYPQFENIVSLDDPNKIQDNYDYYFKIAIGITSNSVRLLDILTVKEFDERMDWNVISRIKEISKNARQLFANFTCVIIIRHLIWMILTIYLNESTWNWIWITFLVAIF